MLRITSPADGSLVAEIPWDSDATVREAIARASSAQASWARVPVAERRAQVEAALDVFRDHEDEICREISMQMGKPLAQAHGELSTMLDRAEHMCSIAEDSLRPDELSPLAGFRRRIEHVPLGVVFNIVAWNYPLLLPVSVIVPGLLAGNAVLLKHSPITAMTGRWFSKAFAAVGGGGLVQDLVIDHDLAASVLSDPAINHVAFTGSVRGGRSIDTAIAGRLISCGLELGGSDAAYVASDADLEYAASSIVDGACYNAGQSCCAVERVYVHQDRYQDFIALAKKHVEAYVVGDPLDKASTMGPLARAEGAAAAAAQVEQAVKDGANLVLGGALLEKGPHFFAPTLVTDTPESTSLFRDETFAPVVAIAQVASDEAAVDQINHSRFGLTASLWTADVDRAERLAPEIRTGTVFQNRCDFLDPALPWTGVGESGRGVTLSRYGFLELTRRKSLHFRTKTS